MLTEIISPPLWEGMRVTNGTEDRQIQDKADDLGSTVESTSNNVVVYIIQTRRVTRVRSRSVESAERRTFREPPRVPLTDPELRDQTDDHGGVDLSIDTNYAT